MRTVYILARLAFGGVFIAASLNKVADPATFAQFVANYHILPDILVNPAALVLPWIELICGAALVFGVFSRGAVLVLNLLMLVFLASLAHAWYYGIDIACGCFTFGDQTGDLGLSFARDAGILLVGLIALAGQFQRGRDRSRLILD